MTVHRDPPFNGQWPDDELPAQLAAAVAKARARNPTSDMVEQLVARASRLGEDARVAPAPHRSTVLGVSACAIVAAAVVLLIFTLANRTREPVRLPDQAIASAAAFPIYSAVTKSSLVEVGFGQIEEDLQRAESHLANASETVALAEVRRDVRATLEEYRRWGN